MDKALQKLIMRQNKKPKTKGCFMINAYIVSFKEWSDFEDRTSRKDFWQANIMHWAIIFGLAVLPTKTLQHDLFTNTFVACYFLIAFFPLLSLQIRRFHDMGKSGWWIVISYIPFIGLVIWFIWMLRAGDENTNQYGANPNQLQ